MREVQLDNPVEVSTQVLFDLACNTRDEGLPSILDGEIFLNLDPDGQHTLTILAVLDRIVDKPSAPYLRCSVVAKLREVEDRVEQKHFDVLMKDYMEAQS